MTRTSVSTLLIQIVTSFSEYVLEVDSTIQAGSPIIVDQEWSRDEDKQVDLGLEEQSIASVKSQMDEDASSQM